MGQEYSHALILVISGCVKRVSVSRDSSTLAWNPGKLRVLRVMEYRRSENLSRRRAPPPVVRSTEYRRRRSDRPDLKERDITRTRTGMDCPRKRNRSSLSLRLFMVEPETNAVIRFTHMVTWKKIDRTHFMLDIFSKVAPLAHFAAENVASLAR